MLDSKKWDRHLLCNASSKAQKDLTTEYAKDVEGVKKAVNNMTIK